MKRAVLKTADTKEARSTRVESGLPTFSAGATMIDLMLGGGWAENQLINIVGDSGTGKSLMALEAAANYHQKYPDHIIRWVDSEAAFDESIAANLGIDLSKVERPSFKDVPRTVEGISKDIFDIIGLTSKGKKKEAAKKKYPGVLYIIDSWDGLSSNDELERDADATNTYGTAKATKGSILGRKMSSRLEKFNVTVIIVSQVRENIGVTFGAKYRRNGGKWLDFYATQIIWLAYGEKLAATRARSKREYGRWITYKLSKNRRRAPSAPVTVPILYGYGTDDLMGCLKFIYDEQRSQEFFPDLKSEQAAKELKDFIARVWSLPDEEYRPHLKRARKLARQTWAEIDEAFAPKRKKYSEHGLV